MMSFYQDTVEEFKKKTGEDYSDHIYPTVESIPADLKHLVSTIKMYSASVELLKIRSLLQKYVKNGVAVIPDEHKHFVDEIKHYEYEEKFWASVVVSC